MLVFPKQRLGECYAIKIVIFDSLQVKIARVNAPSPASVLF